MARPRLAAHVVARRHRADGDDRVVLHDLASGRLVVIGAREWGLLAAADGTRDVEGILLAAAREGAHARAAGLEAFLHELDAAGLLDDGPEEAPSPVAAAREDEDDRAANRPLEPLPGFTLACDGRGSCCRVYASVVFGPVEAARARALLPLVLEGGERHERVFMPEHGSGPTGGAAVALVDGRCAYLAPSGRCGLHEAGGPSAKPVGCATFPATFVDDGETVRVSVAVECACVLASAGRTDGAPLVARDVRVRSHLPAALSVRTVPPNVEVARDRAAPRAVYVAWSRRVAELLAAPEQDVAAALWSLGSAVDARGLGEDPGPCVARPAPIDDAALLPWFEALARRAERRAREDAAWRSPRDLARRATAWIAEAAARLLDPATRSRVLGAPPRAPRSEALYGRAVLHGHQLVGALPLSRALQDRAVRLLVARALGVVLEALPASLLDPACEHPLALVEAMLRGHGLDAYAHDLEVG